VKKQAGGPPGGWPATPILAKGVAGQNGATPLVGLRWSNHPPWDGSATPDKKKFKIGCVTTTLAKMGVDGCMFFFFFSFFFNFFFINYFLYNAMCQPQARGEPLVFGQKTRLRY
jgi:hypothetical protein